MLSDGPGSGAGTLELCDDVAESLVVRDGETARPGRGITVDLRYVVVGEHPAPDQKIVTTLSSNDDALQALNNERERLLEEYDD